MSLLTPSFCTSGGGVVNTHEAPTGTWYARGTLRHPPYDARARRGVCLHTRLTPTHADRYDGPPVTHTHTRARARPSPPPPFPPFPTIFSGTLPSTIKATPFPWESKGKTRRVGRGRGWFYGSAPLEGPSPCCASSPVAPQPSVPHPRCEKVSGGVSGRL